MKSLFSLFLVSLLGGGLCTVLMGCSSAEVDSENPAAIMAEVEEEIENHHYLLALEKLQRVSARFPYSEYSIQAKLRKADVYFYQESFSEAAFAYETFQSLHPQHARAAYAAFQTGEAYRSEIPSQVERDLTSAQKAWEAYQKFLDRYPTDARAGEAREKIKSIREILAEKQARIAAFYQRREFYEAARARYDRILKDYGETQVAERTRLILEQPPFQGRP